MKNAMIARYLFLCVLVVSGSLLGTAQQKLVLPVVSFAEVPLYPPLARAANVTGVVHVVVTTDGYRVVTTRVQDGKKILSDAVEQNVKSWQFAIHERTTFTVTYVYKLVDDLKSQGNNPRVVLRLPLEVEVDAGRWLGTKDMAPTLTPHSAP